MRKILMCGSFAYDHIMSFSGKFKDHILPDQLHALNVSFLATEMRREFGGCAGNIAYNLNLLEPGVALPMATVGGDFNPYKDWFNQQGIVTEYLRVLPEQFTAQAFIITDSYGNQITVFHPGAMDYSEKNHIFADDNILFAILSPDGREGMMQHLNEFVELGIPFIFDPGQGTPMFSGAELKGFIKAANWIIANDYEWRLIVERTAWQSEEIISQGKVLIVTHSANGSTIYTQQHTYQIPALSVTDVDPTGCGDAYRAGLLYGLMHKMDWQTAGHIATLMGALKVVSAGTQNHCHTMQEIKQCFKDHFGYDF